MKFAQRMSRLGTETAFEVLVRAQALEAKGRDVVHLEIGEPDFDTPAEHRRGRARGAARRAPPTTRPRRACRELREAIARDVVGAARDRVRRRTMWWSRLAASRSCSSRSWRWWTPATR